MTEVLSIFKADSSEAQGDMQEQLMKLTGSRLSANYFPLPILANCFSLSYATSASSRECTGLAYVRKRYPGVNVQNFTLGMKIVSGESIGRPDELFVAVDGKTQTALEQVAELEKKLAELKEELSKPTEALYKVVLPNPHIKTDKTVCLTRRHDEIVLLQSRSIGLFTEAEIKQDFGWAWQFAERVEV